MYQESLMNTYIFGTSRQNIFLPAEFRLLSWVAPRRSDLHKVGNIASQFHWFNNIAVETFESSKPIRLKNSDRIWHGFGLVPPESEIQVGLSTI